MSILLVGAEHNILNPNSMTFDEHQKQIEDQANKEKEEQEKAKKSPFKNFVQINKDYYKVEDWLMAKSPIAYRIFKFLVNNMDGYNAVICSQTVLQETFDVSRVTVSRAIKILKDKKYIDVYKTGTSNVYAVNKNIVWNSWGTNYQYAKFGANIILSESEQEITIQTEIKTIKHKEVTTVKKNNIEDKDKT